jgi:hypothetical protein
MREAVRLKHRRPDPGVVLGMRPSASARLRRRESAARGEAGARRSDRRTVWFGRFAFGSV